MEKLRQFGQLVKRIQDISASEYPVMTDMVIPSARGATRVMYERNATDALYDGTFQGEKFFAFGQAMITLIGGKGEFEMKGKAVDKHSDPLHDPVTGADITLYYHGSLLREHVTIDIVRGDITESIEYRERRSIHNKIKNVIGPELHTSYAPQFQFNSFVNIPIQISTRQEQTHFLTFDQVYEACNKIYRAYQLTTPLLKD